MSVEIVGVEMSAEYAEIAEARARFWQGSSGLFEELTRPDPGQPDAQETMVLE